MIVAMAIVRMMQVAIDQVVDMIAVGNRGVTAIRSVHVTARVTTAEVPASAIRGIRGVHLQNVLFDNAIARGVVQVTVVQEINMVAMLNPGMAAFWTVDVVMVGVFRHFFLLECFLPGRAQGHW